VLAGVGDERGDVAADGGEVDDDGGGEGDFHCISFVRDGVRVGVG
jgi:hypothetical protein